MISSDKQRKKLGKIHDQNKNVYALLNVGSVTPKSDPLYELDHHIEPYLFWNRINKKAMI